MTLYAADEDGTPVCVDCIHGMCVSSVPCEAEHCQCDCGRRELVATLELERADPARLFAERFGRRPA